MFASMCAASFHRIPLGTRNSSKRSTQEHFCSVLLDKVLLVNGCCCFWIPFLFFVGASNVLKDCERYDAGTTKGEQRVTH